MASRQTDHRGVIEHLEAAIRLGETSPRLHLLLAQSHHHLKDPRRALASLDRAGEAAAMIWGAWLIRAQSHLELGQRLQAFTALTEGLRRHARQVALGRQLVLLLVRLKLYVQVSEEGHRLLTFPDTTLEDSLGIAEALRRAGQPRAAALLLEESRLRAPYNRQVLLQLARCHLDDGKPLAAATLLHRAALVDPTLTVEAAELYRRARQPGLALMLNAQVTDQPKKIQQRFGLLMELGRFDEAVALAPRLSRLGLLADVDILFALGFPGTPTGVDFPGPPGPPPGLISGTPWTPTGVDFRDPLDPHRGAIDEAMDVVEVPEVIRAHRLEAFVVPLALDLGRPVAGILHHAASGLHRDLGVFAAELVANLTRPEARVAVPLVEDLFVALGLDVRRVGPRSGRVSLAFSGAPDLALPGVDGEAAHLVLAVRGGHALRRCVLQDLGLLRRRVALGHHPLAGPLWRRESGRGPLGRDRRSRRRGRPTVLLPPPVAQGRWWNVVLGVRLHDAQLLRVPQGRITLFGGVLSVAAAPGDQIIRARP